MSCARATIDLLTALVGALADEQVSSSPRAVKKTYARYRLFNATLLATYCRWTTTAFFDICAPVCPCSPGLRVCPRRSHDSTSRSRSSSRRSSYFREMKPRCKVLKLSPAQYVASRTSALPTHDCFRTARGCTLECVVSFHVRYLVCKGLILREGARGPVKKSRIKTLLDMEKPRATRLLISWRSVAGCRQTKHRKTPQTKEGLAEGLGEAPECLLDGGAGVVVAEHSVLQLGDEKVHSGVEVLKRLHSSGNCSSRRLLSSGSSGCSAAAAGGCSAAAVTAAAAGRSAAAAAKDDVQWECVQQMQMQMQMQPQPQQQQPAGFPGAGIPFSGGASPGALTPAQMQRQQQMRQHMQQQQRMQQMQRGGQQGFQQPVQQQPGQILSPSPHGTSTPCSSGFRFSGAV